MDFKARFYLFTVGIAGLIASAVYLPQLDLEKYLIPLLLLAAASFISEVYELEILPRWGLSTAISLKLAAIYIGGAPLGVGVVLLSTLPAEILLSWDRLKEGISSFLSRVIFNTGQLLLSVIASALVFQQFEGWFGESLPPYHSLQSYIPLILAFFIYEAINASLVSGIISLVSSKKFTYILRFSLKNLHLQFLTMGVLAILMAILYATSPWNLVLAFVPLALVHYSVRNYLRLRRDSHAAFKDITRLVALRDIYTGSHSDDVETLAVALAEALKLPEDQIETVRAGAAIHDLGKIGVPDAILNKPGPLNDEEWRIMKRHPIIGADVIKELEIYRDVVPIV
ncbi:HD domain-containing protein, partial [Candidatus Parcubacteria bacterium]